MPSFCNIKDCVETNDNTANYTNDWGDVRYYCDEHWNLIRLFFTKIAAHACKFCKRNHHVETDPNHWRESTVKYCGKYWDLCPMHIGIYEDCLDYFHVQLPED